MTRPPPHLQRLAAATRAWRVLLGLLLVLITVLALMPAPPHDLTLGWDKLNHLMAFAALGFCACLGWHGPSRLRALAALLAYGALIEVLQSFTPNRSAEWADLFSDGLGITVGVAFAWGALRSMRAPAPSG